jgi:hypothetical protein
MVALNELVFEQRPWIHDEWHASQMLVDNRGQIWGVSRRALDPERHDLERWGHRPQRYKDNCYTLIKTIQYDIPLWDLAIRIAEMEVYRGE